jgi:hypothetical protein
MANLVVLKCLYKYSFTNVTDISFHGNWDRKRSLQSMKEFASTTKQFYASIILHPPAPGTSLSPDGQLLLVDDKPQKDDSLFNMWGNDVKEGELPADLNEWFSNMNAGDRISSSLLLNSFALLVLLFVNIAVFA